MKNPMLIDSFVRFMCRNLDTIMGRTIRIIRASRISKKLAELPVSKSIIRGVKRREVIYMPAFDIAASAASASSSFEKGTMATAGGAAAITKNPSIRSLSSMRRRVESTIMPLKKT